MGHHATDELSALLAVGRARSWQEFLTALEGFAIPAQNMIYADADGHIGQAMAAHLPSRPHVVPQDMIEKASALKHWDQMVSARDLPHRLDPPEGFVASANNMPARARVAIGFFFSPDERVNRLRELLGGPGKVSRENLTAVQNDVTVPSATALRDLVVRVLDEPGSTEKRLPVLEALRAWDGAYAVDSRGALAFELIAYHFVVALHGRENVATYLATWDPWALLREDLDHADRARVRGALHKAARRAQPSFARLRSWGNAHRLRLRHAFGSAPLVGRRFRYADLPTAGGNETVMKTAYGFSAGRHRVRLGANARHISDLGDPDANYFVLLGGQDGWLGSANFLDQLALWRDRAMIHVPLRLEAVRAAFPHLTTMSPRPAPQAEPCSTLHPS
jgi:penicillin amidase